MMSMNEDLFIEILCRLSVKTLLQIRYVCKAWYALIKSSRFTHKHLEFQRAYGAGDDERIIVKYFKDAENRDVLTLYNDYESLSLLNAPPPEIEIQGSRWPFNLAGETNGVFCLWNKYDISLMNPVLREFRMIPALYGRAYSARPVAIGFAFHKSTYDYRILRVDRVIDDRYKVGALYSLSSNSWRELGRIHLLDYYDLNSNSCSVFINGSIHWLTNSTGCPIFTFSITTELFKEMQAPQQLQDEGSGYEALPVLIVFDKSFLALVSFSETEVSSGLLFTVWVMKEYGMADSWIQEYRIQTVPSIERPLCFWKNDKLLFATHERDNLLFASNERELICHDLPTGKLHQLQEFRFTRFVSFGLMAFNESLISISS